MSNLSTNHTFPNDFGVSYYYYYFHPIISFISTFLSLMSSIVLSDRELRSSSPFFKYSMINSIGYTVYSFLVAFLFLTNCRLLCETSTMYLSQAFTIYAIYFIAGGIYTASGLIQIAIGFQLYFTIKDKDSKKSHVGPYKICIIFFGNLINI